MFFEGRIDRTMAMIDPRQLWISNEHIVLTTEPDMQYIEHVTPEINIAVNDLLAISDFL